MARGAHGWPSLHICQAAGEANIDEVNRAHRGPYHELNISRYSRARGEYCTYTWKVRNESFMVGFWSISRSFLSFFFFVSLESRFTRLPCRRSRSIVPFCWRMGPWLAISPVRFEACEHMAKGELLRAGVLFSSFGSRRRMVENGELESVNARFKAVEESDLKALVNGAMQRGDEESDLLLAKGCHSVSREKNDPIVFATCTPQECNGFLCRFYASMRPNADERSSSSTSIRRVLLGTDFLSNNCGAGASCSGREFQSSGRITDQHQAIRKLLDKLHPAVPKLFQRVHPTFQPSNKVWFMKAPLGHNLLSSMMKCISVSAGLLRSYSNHCLRATSIVTLLQKAGFSDRMICSVSGHKNPSSLAAYNRPGKDEEKTMAAALDSVLVSPKEESSFTSAHPVSDTAAVDALLGSPERSSSQKLRNESSEAIQPLLVTGKQASFKNVTISFVRVLNVYPSKRGPEISPGTEEAPWN